MKFIKKVKEKIREKQILIASALAVTFLSSPMAVYADALSSAESATKGVTTFGGSLTKKIIPIVVLAIGVSLFVGGQRARESVKEGAAWKIGGLILIFGATAFGATIGGWF